MAKLTLAGEFPEIGYDEWAKDAAQSIKSQTIDKLIKRSADGLEIQPIYPRSKAAYQPLCNGNSNSWEVVQRVDIPDLVTANEQILQDLLNGATGISLVLPGSVNANGFGVPVNSTDDFKKLLRDIELDLISVRLDAGFGGRKAAINLLQVYKDRNYDLGRCKVNFALDPIAAFARTGAMVAKQELSKRIADIVEQVQKAGSDAPVLCGDGRTYHEAGATPGQELGFALASLLEQLRILDDAGKDLKKAIGQLSVVLSADADQFATISKMRAMRILWRKLCDAFGFAESEILIEVETSARMMSRYDPHVNLLRATTAVFAAGIGGANSICVLPFSHKLGLPDRFARRMARNCQIVLQEESSIGMVCDAAAGSGYVEEFSTRLAQTAWTLMQTIEQNGGMLASLEDGTVQAALKENVAASKKAITLRKHGLVGVSEFANLERTEVGLLDFQLSDTWQTKDAGEAEQETAHKCQKLKNISDPEVFEDLRERAERFGTPPFVRLVNLGDASQYAARSTWATNFFAAGGIGTQTKTGKTKVACICSSDKTYEREAEAVAQQLKKEGFDLVFLAGNPKTLKDRLSKAGVDKFAYVGCDIAELLSKTLDVLEGQK